ncbi:MAG: hypothetical protein SCL54_14400, partial [Bacillota bacterium]|nr:hypothetical protein [Bacillota bacterium]
MLNLMLDLFNHSTEYQSLKKSLNDNVSPILIHGSDVVALKWALQKLAMDLNRNIIVFFEDENKAKVAAEEIDEAIYLPSREMVWFDSFAHSNQVSLERMEALIRLDRTEKGLLFTSINNLAYKYPSRTEWIEQVIELDLDTDIPLDAIQKRLFEFGYERVDIVEAKGQYSLRGGILDVFSPTYETPHRIEFFGDEVDSIRTFDIENQKSIEKLKTLKLFPCSELVLTDELIEHTVDRLKGIRGKIKAQKREKIDEMIEHLETGTYVENIDKYFSLIYEDGQFIYDLCDAPVICIIGNNQTTGRLKQYVEEYGRQFADYLERGEVVSEQYGRIHTFEEIIFGLKRQDLILDELLIKRVDYFEPAQIIKMSSREM